MHFVREIYPSVSEAKYALEIVSKKVKVKDYEITTRASIEKYITNYNEKIFKKGLLKVIFTSSFYTFLSTFFLCSLISYVLGKTQPFPLSNLIIASVMTLLIIILSSIIYIFTRQNDKKINECGIKGENALLVVKVKGEDVRKAKDILINV